MKIQEENDTNMSHIHIPNSQGERSLQESRNHRFHPSPKPGILEECLWLIKTWMPPSLGQPGFTPCFGQVIPRRILTLFSWSLPQRLVQVMHGDGCLALLSPLGRWSLGRTPSPPIGSVPPAHEDIADLGTCPVVLMNQASLRRKPQVANWSHSK